MDVWHLASKKDQLFFCSGQEVIVSSCGISVWGGLLPLGLRYFKLQKNKHHPTVQWGDKSSRPTEVVVLCPPLDLLCCLTPSWANFNSLIWQKTTHSVKKSGKKLMQRRQEWENRWSQQSDPPISSSLVRCKLHHVLSVKNQLRILSPIPNLNKTYHTSQGSAVRMATAVNIK